MASVEAVVKEVARFRVKKIQDGASSLHNRKVSLTMEAVHWMFDLGDFSPAPQPSKGTPAESSQIGPLANDTGSPSTQAVLRTRRQRRHITGRNQQINIKATAETIARIGHLAEQHEIPLGELLARALTAFEKAQFLEQRRRV